MNYDPSLRFGTDGIRGAYLSFPITPDDFQQIAFSYASVMLSHYPDKPPVVLLGRDTRQSSAILSQAVAAGLILAGIDVWEVGVVSTPIAACLTRDHPILGACVVSASHNLYRDNGIKFFSTDGFKLSSSLEKEIVRHFYQRPAHRSVRTGHMVYRYELKSEYFQKVYQHFLQYTPPRLCRVVLDCAHGAVSSFAPSLLRALGFEVLCVGCRPNGYNINNLCGSTSPYFLAREVQKEKADIGLSFDGDGDRALLVSSHGVFYDGDMILYLFARRFLHQKKLSGVVGSVMTNSALEHFFSREGVPFYRSPVGDKNILQMMRTHSASLGGEPSGHLIVEQGTGFCSDAVFNMLHLIFLFPSTQAIDEECATISLYPQKLLNVTIKKQYNWQSDSCLQLFLADLISKWGDTVRILIRSSGTEPVLRIMVEGEDTALISSVADSLAHVVFCSQNAD